MEHFNNVLTLNLNFQRQSIIMIRIAYPLWKEQAIYAFWEKNKNKN